VIRGGDNIYYHAVNRAGANKSREVRRPLLVKVLAARRRDKADCGVGKGAARLKESFCGSVPTGESPETIPRCRGDDPGCIVQSTCLCML
jgi:hypothetical protein